MSNNNWLRLFRVMEEVAWIGGFVLVADKANIWVALGVSAMFIGFNLKNARVAR